MSVDSEAFFLNQLRNPRIIPPLYSYLSKVSNQTTEDVVSGTGIAQKLVEEGLEALQFFELIEKKHEEYKTVGLDPWNVEHFGREYALKIEMLSVLTHKARKGRQWQKQAAFY